MEPLHPTAVLMILLLLLTSGLEAENVAVIKRRFSQRPIYGHRRIHHPYESNFFNGYGTRNFQQPRVYVKEFIRPNVDDDDLVDLNEPEAEDHNIALKDLVKSLIPSQLRDMQVAKWNSVKSGFNRRLGSSYFGEGIEPRTIFFNSFDDWASALQASMKRDAVYNIGKIGGLLILYYFFPGILDWINSTFGSV